MSIKKIEINETKTCDSCKYFVKHYTIDKDKLKEIMGCGHCVCGKLRYHAFYKKLKYDLPCDYWEEKESVEQKRQRIKGNISHMADDLNEILQILNID